MALREIDLVFNELYRDCVGTGRSYIDNKHNGDTVIIIYINYNTYTYNNIIYDSETYIIQCSGVNANVRRSPTKICFLTFKLIVLYLRVCGSMYLYNSFRQLSRTIEIQLSQLHFILSAVVCTDHTKVL